MLKLHPYFTKKIKYMDNIDLIIFLFFQIVKADKSTQTDFDWYEQQLITESSISDVEPFSRPHTSLSTRSDIETHPSPSTTSDMMSLSRPSTSFSNFNEEITSHSRPFSALSKIKISSEESLALQLDDTPRKRKLKFAIRKYKLLYQRNRQKVKRLSQTQRRIKKTISNLKSVLESLKEKKLMSGEDLITLSNITTDLKIKDLISRQ